MKNIRDKVFTHNLPSLENIFGWGEVVSKKERLLEIYDRVEQAWEENLNRLVNKKIEFILIAEAAPWSQSGNPRYFYNEIESRYHKSIWGTFYPYTKIPKDKEKAFSMLVEQKFLLIDTIPFSMDYSGKRNHRGYYEIILNSIRWWIEKLNNDKITFTKDVKAAFAFKKNGFAVMKACGGKLILKNGQVIKLNEKNIAADGSGYTSSKKLKEIFLI